MSGFRLSSDLRHRSRKIASKTAKVAETTVLSHIVDVVMVATITACCLAIEINAPEPWRPYLIWLMLAPAGGLLFGVIPAMVLRRRLRVLQKREAEQTDLIGLLLKDYAADRGDWLWSCDIDGNLQGVSQKFASQAGQKVSALQGTPFLDFLRGRLPEESSAYSEIVMAMRQRKPFFDIEIAVKVRSTECWWRLAGKPIFRDNRFAGFVGTASDITAEMLAKETISFLAYNDGLTGLANRSHFSKRLNECVSRLERYGSAFSVLYLDLDKFKAVNDSRGHQAGDKLLVEVGRRLGSLLRETDMVARLGGDEFAVIAPDDADAATISQLAARLIAEIEKPYSIDGDALIIGLSVGIAIAPINGTRPDQILRNADLALYRAKAEGGNRYCFFESKMDSEIRERRVLELELAEALEREEFVLYYQPLISTADGTVSGFEGLIRWNHPIRGLVPPGEFIPIAERSTLIGSIGEWTIAEACRMLARLPERLTIAINLSTKHFRTADIASVVVAAAAAAGVEPKRLELEITESLLVDNPEEMARKLRELRRTGTKIAMDDFGTGFSSLSYLLKFPFDKIKIDRSFVSASSEDNAAKEILRAIIALAGTLEIMVTAEGVETQEQAEFLSETGCDLLQGYLFARPMPEADLAPLLGIKASETAAIEAEMAELLAPVEDGPEPSVSVA